MNKMKLNPLNFKKVGLISWLAILWLVHGNAILKHEDPIQDTQTEAILYDQKMEQEKDGVKAAATPKVIYYGGQGFLTKSSLAKNEKEGEGASAKKKKQSFNWSDWWEEKPAEPETQEQAAVEEELPVKDEALQESESGTESDLPNETPVQEEAETDFWAEAPDSPGSTATPPTTQEAPSKPAADDWW